MNYSLPIIFYLASAFLVTRIPFIKTYLSLSYTLLHEMIRVLIMGGESKKIILLKKGSTSETTNYVTLKHDFISYISYTAPSLMAIGLFYFVSINDYHLILYILIGLIAVSIVFWIRHFLEFLWALSFMALLALPIYFRYELVVMHLAIFLASYILVQSVLNALNVCRHSFINRKANGVLAKVKGIPSMILGLTLLVQSIFAGYFIVSNFVLHIGVPWAKFDFAQIPWV
ncbi:M50 family metallopeptidase [Bacillus sp. CGMCC 1.16607]|uniref:M50 family metallopeptidase n=1 Tax=Bacillus sp. CGMCC 1.16607 TaxID=3351842 RepID=UPI003633B1E6